jgi:enoyl-CoA hydratase/carnithine racemase
VDPAPRTAVAQTGISTVDVEVRDQVATVRTCSLAQLATMREEGIRPVIYFDLGSELVRLREDDGVRVIVITGAEDGQPMGLPALADWTGEVLPVDYSPHELWRSFLGIRLSHQAIVEMEKPVIARVNGDALNFHQSIVLACDLIVAWEDARICDAHMNGKRYVGFDVVPGDGGAAFIPLHLPPAKAMEYLLLGKEYTAAELERLGVINYAVPLEQLDEVVQRLVSQLLDRSAYALAYTKRIAKRRVAEHLNLTFDAAAAYELSNILQRQLDGADPRSLR